MMNHDYKEYSIKMYVPRQLYGPDSKNRRWTQIFKQLTIKQFLNRGSKQDDESITIKMNQSLLKGLVILLSINQIHGGIKLNKLKWRLSNRFY